MLATSRTADLTPWFNSQYVSGYLHSYPDAKDTAEGIANWWLRARGANVDQSDVKEALNDLLATGCLTVTGSLSSHRIYGLNPLRRTELQQLLESSE